MIKKLILIPLCLFLLKSPVFAGGGRILINHTSRGVVVNIPAYVSAQVFNNGQLTGFSIGENLEFRVDNPRPGDFCNTTRGVSNEAGMILGECFAQLPGEVNIYVHSLTKGDNSSKSIIYFDIKPTPTPIPIFSSPDISSLPLQILPSESPNPSFVNSYLDELSMPIEVQPKDTISALLKSIYQFFKSIFQRF